MAAFGGFPALRKHLNVPDDASEDDIKEYSKKIYFATDLFEQGTLMRVWSGSWETIVNLVKTLTVVIEEGAMDQAPLVPAQLPNVPEVPNARPEALVDVVTPTSSAATLQILPIIPNQPHNPSTPIKQETEPTGDSTRERVATPLIVSDHQSTNVAGSQVPQKRSHEATTATPVPETSAPPSTSGVEGWQIPHPSRRVKKAPAPRTPSAPAAPIVSRLPSEDEEGNEGQIIPRSSGLVGRSLKVSSLCSLSLSTVLK